MTSKATLKTRYYLQAMSTSTVDSSGSLLVHFEDKAYLFNAPEGISRIFVQNGRSMKKIGQIFLGELANSGGLPGMILSTTEAGRNNLDVIGPLGMDHLIASYRLYTRRDRLALHMHELLPTPVTTPELPSPIHSDSNLIVYAFQLFLPSHYEYHESKRSRSPSDSGSDIEARPKKRKRSFSPSTGRPAKTFEPLDTSQPDFSAAKLVGPAARVWKNMVIKDMFKGTGEKKYVHVDQMEAYQKNKAAPSPSYRHEALPPPHPAVQHKAAVCYLGVGPSLRGRFLPHEAKRRGVPEGFRYAKLTEGVRVWVPIVGDLPYEEEPPLQEIEGETAEARKEREKERTKMLTKKAKMREREKRERQNQVKDGEGVGFWVEPEDCMGPGQDGSAFLVLNIPSPEYLPSLANVDVSMFANLKEAHLRTVFYFLGPGVLSDPRLQTFISSLPSNQNISHRITSPDIPDSNSITFLPTTYLSHRLSFMSKRIFNVPKYSFMADRTDPLHLPSGLSSLPNVQVLHTSDQYPQAILTPPSEKHLALQAGAQIKPISWSMNSKEAEEAAAALVGPNKSKAKKAAGVEAWKNYLPIAKRISDTLDQEEEERKRTEANGEWKEELRVTPLGTGSAVPSKYRNVSSTLLHLPREKSDDERRYILLDAGEGTWGQLARRFGTHGDETIDDVLRGLKAIFISHLHQDHHAGIATILRKRLELDPAPTDQLVVAGPGGLRMYLYDQNWLFDMGLLDPVGQRRAVLFWDNDFIGRPFHEGDSRVAPFEEWKERLGLTEFKTAYVLHRCRAWGLSIAHKSGWKVVFSGDTMPCDKLVELGMDATLLIHEATIEDGLEDIAQEKGHSTFGQAIDIGRRMRAKHLLLTHFSARYPKLPPPPAEVAPEDQSEGEDPDIFLAFDLITLRLSDFRKMEVFRPAMDVLLGWDEDDKSSVAGSEAPEDVKEGKKVNKGKFKDGKNRKGKGEDEKPALQASKELV